MNRSRITGDLVSQNNIFVDIANDRVGIGSTIPGQKLSLPDSAKIALGNSADLEIYHDGSHSYIHDGGTGNLKLRSNNFRLSNTDESKISATFVPSGAAELYHNNAKKFETTAYGIDVTGTTGTDGLTISGVTTFSASNTPGLQLTNATFGTKLYIGGYDGGTNSSNISRIRTSTGNLHIDSASNGGLYLNHYSTGTVYVRGNRVLTTADEGSGNGLDADTLDGQQGSYYADAASYVKEIETDDNITTRMGSGFYETSTATTAEGWPVTSNNYYHLISSTHSNTGNYYSMQIAGDFFTQDNFYIRSTNASGTTAWSEIWTSSSDGSGSGLDADTVDGIEGASFLRSDANDSTSGSITFSSDSTGITLYGGGRFYKQGGSGLFVRLPSGGQQLQVENNSGTTLGTFWHSGNDGSGSGLDSDTLDGQQGSYYRNATNLNAGTIDDARLPGTITSSITGNSGSTDALKIIDTRNDGARVPNDYADHKVTAEFTNQIINGWHTALTVKGWADGYAPWQLVGYSDTGQNTNLRVRFGHGQNNTWSSLYNIWHTGNDGSGSGLDADTLDGIQASSFVRSDAEDTINAPLSISAGSVNAANDATLYITATNNNDWGLKINNYNNSATEYGARIEVGSSATYALQIVGSGNEVFRVNGAGTVYAGGSNTVWHAGNDGSGSGLDADTLDGIGSASFLRSDATDSASGSISFTNTYYEFGNSTGSVSNDGGWHARLNLAGTQHARLDVQSVSDGIITTMYSHTGHTSGKVGTKSNHHLSFITNNNTRATLSTAGSLDTTVQGTLWGASNDGSGSGLDADTLDGVQGASFLRSDASDSSTQPVTFSGGGGAVTIGGNSDIRLSSGSWTGEHAGKIQHHGNILYIQGGSSGFYFRNSSGSNILQINASGNISSDNGSIQFDKDIVPAGGAGAVTINANSDIRFNNGSWTGDAYGKIQHHSNRLYIGGGSDGIYFRENNTNRWIIDGSGHFRPHADSTYDIGTNSDRVRNVYADTYYGSASGLTASTLPTAEAGISAVGNFGQWESHGAYSNFNTEPNYWGWNYVQGTTNAPNTASGQWYRCRLSLGSNYGKGSDVGDYSMEMTIPRTQNGTQGQMWVRPIENGVESSWMEVGSRPYNSVIPRADNAIDLGSSSIRWANLYTADAHFNNIGTGGNEIDGTEGSWTLQEAEDTVYMINRKNGKRYKIKMEEV